MVQQNSMTIDYGITNLGVDWFSISQLPLAFEQLSGFRKFLKQASGY
jgi:hypothetical protein